MREIQLLHDLGIRDINIIDDNFNFDNKRAVTIFNEIEKRNLGMRFYFGNGVRGDRLPKDVLDAMVSGGTIYMVYALETGSERMQKYIKKGLNLNKFEQSIRYAIDTGIMVEMFTMVGFPTETEEEIGQTLDFAMKLEGLCMIYLNVVNYFPGTEL
ncbi:MAG: radical SAM protein, partial [candidate division Zixibacteria bacterium]|nr:radical SAM protein [Gammaproteobacteria bacterium]NIR63164.1 radical SAM protein [candidate division Zixibacteria bacterium]NIX55204.1 radical SAM protein [candidate division Zixibacteria bacterium]